MFKFIEAIIWSIGEAIRIGETRGNYPPARPVPSYEERNAKYRAEQAQKEAQQ